MKPNLIILKLKNLNMAKLPYIPIYIGDWEQDTNTISLEAEGALLKIIFKLWKSPEKGLLTISLQQLSFLLKKSEELTLKIAEELKQNNVLNVTFLQQNFIKFESRRMTKEAHISKVRSKSGSEGGKQSSSKLKAKSEEITEYESENVIENVIENLNEVTNSSYRVNSEKNIKFIQARLNEGFTLQDFKDVISAKQFEWGNDPVMNKFLRPETLFGNKFEGYLQSTKKIIHGGTGKGNQNSQHTDAIRVGNESLRKLEEIGRNYQHQTGD